MSYLTEAVTEITTNAENAAFLHVQETQSVEIRSALDAFKYGKRFYRKETGYDGPLHHTAQEVDDGWQVMLMEEAPIGGGDAE